MNVLVQHHAWLGILGGKRIRCDMRPGSREPRMQRRLARVWRTDERNLCRTFGADHQRRPAMSRTLSGTFEFFGQILDARLDVRLEVLGPFELRDGAQHLAQQLEALSRVAGLAEGGFGRPVIGGEVGGHDCYRSSEWIRRRVSLLRVHPVVMTFVRFEWTK